jgi:hypothetical protein
MAIAGSLLLVSLSYVLLLAAPVITRHFGTLALGPGSLKTLESWLPLACGAGLVLGGASALVFVLTQITREAQRRPYISLAPVLAAFSACVLIGLRAELPLKGVSSEHVAVFAVAVAVVGGALVQMPRMSAQLLGMACTFLPPASLFGVLWVLSGSSDPARAIWGLPPTTRAFLGMLTLCSFAIGAVATLGRRSETVEPSMATGMTAGMTAGMTGGMTARLPVEPQSYALDHLEESWHEDELRLARRGLPGWVIALLGAAALVLSFMAVKLYMERRAATAFLDQASSSPVAPVGTTSAPAATQPSAEPQPSAPVVEPSAAGQALEPAPAQPAVAAEPAPRPAAAEPTRLDPVQFDPQPSQGASASATERDTPRSSKAHARSARHAQRVASRRAAPEPKPAAIPSKPAAIAVAAKTAAVAARPVAVEAKPATKTKAQPEEDSASVALKAARAATKSEPKPAAPAAESKPAPTRGDESLDELMDNVLKPAKGGKKKDVSEDPIYGL